MEDEQPSSDSDELPAPKGKPRDRKAREKVKLAMYKIVNNDAGNPVDMLIAASDRVDDLEEKLENAKEAEAKITRITQNLSVAREAYEKIYKKTRPAAEKAAEEEEEEEEESEVS
ncbi:unnamed protein product [Ectocarpus sp. CCAP 1310/34]|nr:unnamed protein product [Ectocarpus sp. CCAP 1310/34]